MRKSKIVIYKVKTDNQENLHEWVGNSFEKLAISL